MVGYGPDYKVLRQKSSYVNVLSLAVVLYAGFKVQYFVFQTKRFLNTVKRTC